MQKLRILITCEGLSVRGGTELYIRDVARGLLRLGHAPMIYTHKPGAIAAEIRNLTVPVIERLDALNITPDLIYGQHHLPTVAALLRFAGVPAVYVCHDFYAPNAFAPRFPRILRYVAVDETCYERLICEDGISAERVSLLPNSVDLERFIRREPLPFAPRRALLFGNYTEENAHLAALRAVCAEHEIQLDTSGERTHNAVAQPEEVLAEYDIVFAKGRAALEALAVGAAVIVYSGIRYLGQMVRAEDVERLLPLNFGIRAMGDALTPEELARRVAAEIRHYDPADAARATALVRERAGQATAINALAELCAEVVTEYAAHKPELDSQNEGEFAAAYLERLQAQATDFRTRHEQLLVQVATYQKKLSDSSLVKLNRLSKRAPRLTALMRPIARAFMRQN